MLFFIALITFTILFTWFQNRKSTNYTVSKILGKKEKLESVLGDLKGISDYITRYMVKNEDLQKDYHSWKELMDEVKFDIEVLYDEFSELSFDSTNREIKKLEKYIFKFKKKYKKYIPEFSREVRNKNIDELLTNQN